jgi:hypothetical protein
MGIRKLQLTGLVSLTIAVAGCASNTAQLGHAASNKSARGMCAANFTTDEQGRRAARLIRDPEADSGFVSGHFAADIKVWVTAPDVGTKLVTLHATAADDVIPIPVDRIVAVALQSCEAIDDPQQGSTQRVLTTSN